MPRYQQHSARCIPPCDQRSTVRKDHPSSKVVQVGGYSSDGMDVPCPCSPGPPAISNLQPERLSVRPACPSIDSLIDFPLSPSVSLPNVLVLAFPLSRWEPWPSSFFPRTSLRRTDHLTGIFHRFPHANGAGHGCTVDSATGVAVPALWSQSKVAEHRR